ncbi:hypothetical protein [Streptomyces chartreusis]|uniref:hypothetical protein n=1 Tax=Streptomyces chartreusis TaxID=1969 RepID=UPI0033AB1128
MRRGRHCATAAEPHLTARLRSMVWGPPEFVGPPPLRLTAKGFLAGALAAGAIVGSTVAGAWYGIPGPATGECGLVCAALLVLYLCGVRAGRALVGVVAVLAVCLALHAPQAAAGFVLAERGAGGVRGGDLGRRPLRGCPGRGTLPLLGDRPGRRSREGPYLARLRADHPAR